MSESKLDSKISVYMVDDEELITQVISEGLGEDFEIKCFQSAEAALMALENSPAPHIIVSDIRMPGLDGFRFIERLRQINQTSKLIIATGYAEKQDCIRALQLGVHAIVEKPFMLNDLQKVIQEASQTSNSEGIEISIAKKIASLIRCYSNLSEQYFERISVLERNIFDQQVEIFGNNAVDLNLYKNGLSKEVDILKEIEAIKDALMPAAKAK